MTRRYFRAGDGSGTDRGLGHVARDHEGRKPDGKVPVVSLCGAPMAGTFGGPIQPSAHYWRRADDEVVRYSHYCVRCVRTHEREVAAAGES